MASKTLVVVPAFNESQRISDTVASIKKVLPSGDILVVDDCSADDTAERAAAAGALVVRHPINLGYGAALETGYLYACKTGHDILVQMDADGQHLAGEIPRIMDPVVSGDVDIAVGSRYMPDSSSYHGSRVRRFGSFLFGLLLLPFVHRRVTDPTSGFQCLNRRTVELFSSGIFPEDFPDADVLLTAHLCGLRVREVPVSMKERDGGVSMHAGLRPLYYIVKMMLSMIMVALNYKRWRKNGS